MERDWDQAFERFKARIDKMDSTDFWNMLGTTIDELRFQQQFDEQQLKKRTRADNKSVFNSLSTAQPIYASGGTIMLDCA